MTNRLESALALANAIRHKPTSKPTHSARKGAALYAMRKHKRSCACIKCALCQRVFPADSIVIDHIIPVSKGGSGSTDNLRYVCKRCNRIKGIDTDASIPLEAL